MLIVSAVDLLPVSEFATRQETKRDYPADHPAAGLLDSLGSVKIDADKAPGEKCARCWKVLPEVGTVAAHPGLCLRCAEVVGSSPAVAG